jgi:hypothetical protein
MALKNVKVTISRLGVHTMEGNTTVYMPSNINRNFITA